MAKGNCLSSIVTPASRGRQVSGRGVTLGDNTMFTGLIDHCGKITSIEHLPTSKRFSIRCEYTDLKNGESIAVSGVCLTAIDCKPGEFSCDLSPETLAVTTMGKVAEGDLINLERSLQVGERLHGHFVLGHVDQTCRVARKNVLDDYVEYLFSGVSSDKRVFLVPKGSIAINGVSLTLNTVTEDGFGVMLIPETLRKTNLSALKVGDYMNVEYDYLAKIVCNQT